MFIEAALLPRNLLNEGNQIHNFILYLWDFFRDLFYNGSGSGSAKAKVTVPTIPVSVQQQCHCGAVENKQRDLYISKKKANDSYSVFTAVMKLVQIN